MEVISLLDAARLTKRHVYAEELAEMFRGRPKAMKPLRVLYKHNDYDYVLGDVVDVEVGWRDGTYITVMLDDGTLKEFNGYERLYVTS